MNNTTHKPRQTDSNTPHPAPRTITRRIGHSNYKINVHFSDTSRETINDKIMRLIPTIHMGAAATQMERRGIRTERGDINRGIEISNQRLRELKARITHLQNWLKKETANTKPPTLADVIQGILERRAANGNQYALQNLKAAADMLNFLTANRIMDLQGLDDCFGGMIGRQLEIRDKLKPIDRRLKVLDEHIKNAETYFQYRDIYSQYKAQPPKKQSQFYETHRRELTLYETANGYLKGVMNGRDTIPTGAWRKEHDQKTTEKQQLDLEYKTLKAEVGAAEKIRSAVYTIMAQERQREQPNRGRDMER